MIVSIYKIYFGDIVYIGSTQKNLKRRIGIHKFHYQNKIKNKCSIYKYFDLYGFNYFKFELIKEYNCFDKKQGNAFEQLWINKYKMNSKFFCVNEKDTFNILKKYKHKIYRERNKDKIREKNLEWHRKNYNETHKERSKKYKKIYYQNNKAKINEKGKEKYQRNKEKINKKSKEKYNCICGSILRKDGKIKHEKTPKHINFLSK